MQTAKIPRFICDEIDRKTTRFLWGGNETTRKIHNVSWNQVTKNKMMGGLGFRFMRDTDAAFLAKLGWRVLAEKDKLWSQALRAKYCNNRCDTEMFALKQGTSNA